MSHHSEDFFDNQNVNPLGQVRTKLQLKVGLLRGVLKEELVLIDLEQINNPCYVWIIIAVV